MRKLFISGGALVLGALLCGCAGTATIDNPQGYKRAAKSMRFEFSQQSGVKTRVYGPAALKYDGLKKVEQQVAELARLTRTKTLAAVEEAMKARSIPRGDDVTIFVDFKEATHTHTGAGATLSMWTFFKDAPPDASRWTFQVKAGGSVVDSPESTAAKLAEKVVETLVQEGILVPRN